MRNFFFSLSFWEVKKVSGRVVSSAQQQYYGQLNQLLIRGIWRATKSVSPPPPPPSTGEGALPEVEKWYHTVGCTYCQIGIKLGSP